MFNNGYGGDANPYAQNYATGGGASGGGFLANGSQSDSPSGKRAGNNTLRPVTIRQLINAEQPHPDAEFTLDGAELGQLTFVAVVRNISRNATNIAYSVEDGTGQIEVRQWLDSSGDDTNKASDIRQNVYVRVLGTLKSFQNRRSISAGHMRLVTDYNEVMFHRLEAVHSHLQLTRGPKASQANGGGAAHGVDRAQPQTSDINAYSGSANKQNVLDQYKSLEPLPRQIMGIVTTEADKHTDGVHVNLIARMLKGVDVADVKVAVEELSSEGYLYTAADDDHVLPTA
ncbi:related to RFA2-DNA replication factor A, 36 kDa subunit [Sporisorium reilianum SRZ2]|uniref:Related to RFA2-DNA replication factor A, 36 kDa subunit n=1 Tax=Sporisorium reilianum (strain SRZ2) TaxID=999809 RepID=E7A0G9_SPORE|nr:related to RFA2-DNA replication factor A, 36 kDa subunit [Sporisorium reilianum SRZ2]